MKLKIPFYLIVLLTSSILGLNSCKKFLEMPAQTSFNVDSVFSSYQNTERLLFDLYQFQGRALATALNSKLGLASVSTITDEAICFTAQNGYTANNVYAGSVNSTWFTVNGANGEDVYDNHWRTIRKALILKENIDRVPDAPADVKGRIKGECTAMLALEYFEMFKRYGGVPIVKTALNDAAQFNIPRASLDSVYNHIINLCDEAIANPNFPARVPDEKEFGRLTKAFVYGLKSRTMLYAASPLFNNDKPYQDFGKNNRLISFMKIDRNLWTMAAKSAREAITYAEQNGYAIVRNFGVTRNYKVACEDVPKAGNTEVMYGTFQGINQSRNYWTGRGTNMNGFAATEPTQNHVEKYQNTNGTSVNWNTPITTPVNDPTAPYRNLDPRFHLSVAYNGCLWVTTTPTYNLEIYDGADPSVPNGRNGPIVARTQFAYFTRKWLNGLEVAGVWTPMSPYMRLAEIYLNLAEASNEANGPNPEVFAALDVIRSRSGMPNVSRTLDQAGLRNFIENERSIELYLENHRYFDLKRMMKGEVFKGPIFDVRVIRQRNNTYTYTKYKYHDRAWFTHWYLHPFPNNEVNKGYGLIQNPGW